MNFMLVHQGWMMGIKTCKMSSGTAYISAFEEVKELQDKKAIDAGFESVEKIIKIAERHINGKG